MRVFLSWSGDLSKRASLALRDWLPMVVQAVDPYMSAEDIEKGSRWENEIASELEACHFGIICLTPQNIQAPWIYFEAGALSKAVDRARVSPLLLGLKASDVTGPLVQFQSTLPQKPDMLRLVTAINEACGDRGLDPVRLERVFSTMWPQLESDFSRLEAELSSVTVVGRKRTTPDLLEELIALVRGQTRLLTERVVSPEISSTSTPSERERRAQRDERYRLAGDLFGLPRQYMRHVRDRFFIFLPDEVAMDDPRLSQLQALAEFADYRVLGRRLADEDRSSQR